MLSDFLQSLKARDGIDWEISHHEEIPARKAVMEDIPAELHPAAAELIKASGYKRLYAHQAEAARLSVSGRHVVLSTATASGKTLAYQASVFDALARDPSGRALFLFPLKALERDQRDAFAEIGRRGGFTAAVYDGDTPEAERKLIRQTPPHALITNPDMLHLSMLAFHGLWKGFFAGLRYLVLDEVHTYKGIFGSHISQVLLRFRRVCALYASKPRIFASSATVSNPGEFTLRLTGEDVAVVDINGAPASKRSFIFLSPVSSPNTAAARLFVRSIQAGLKTIVFTRARKITELITTWALQEAPWLRNRVSSYRAGFLPEERREIESKLFKGEMDGVITTSALELGIDVGGLDVCILVGYPGTIINTWQRGGRVGRAGRESAIVLIAGQDALDQYFLKNPRDFFTRGCEKAVLDPLNKEVLRRHLPCAAAETPIRAHEEWAQQPEVIEVLEDLEDRGVIFRASADGSWHAYSRRPHRNVDLRGIGESYSIMLENTRTVIGAAGGARVFTECHEGAVYLHRTKQYLVTKLDLIHRNVFVRPERLDYYTRGLAEKETEILGAPLASKELPGFTIRLGRLKVTETIVCYEKRRASGQELLGEFPLELPPLHFETVGFWIEIPDKVKQAVSEAGLDFMGGIHAVEHAAISMFPLFALCDRDDVGGISTPQHPQVCKAAIFMYDGHPGGVGLAQHVFGIIDELLEKTLAVVSSCECESGCPSCIHSPKCGSGNQPLDKTACIVTLNALLRPEEHLSGRVTPVSTAKVEAVRVTGPASPADVPTAIKSPGGHALTGPLAKKKSRIFEPEPEEETRQAVKSRNKVNTARIPRVPSPESAPVIPVASRIRQPDKGSFLRQTGRGAMESKRRYMVFDLETKRLASEVEGGWRNIKAMGMSLAVTYTEEDGFCTFFEEDVAELIAALRSASLIVGFNQIRFDYEALRGYGARGLEDLPNLDLLADTYRTLGFRVGLDAFGEATLGKGKSADGLDAVRWYREGRLDLVEDYCKDDVTVTRDLFFYGIEHGRLSYKTRMGKTEYVPVDWGQYRELRPATPYSYAGITP